MFPTASTTEEGPRKKYKSPNRMKYGALTKMVEQTLASFQREFPTRHEFTIMDLWDRLRPPQKDDLVKAYGSKGNSLDALAAALNKVKDRLGVVLVERHTKHKSLFRISFQYRESRTTTKVPVPIKDPDHTTGAKRTFTLVGFTSDGAELWRDDRTSELGWIEWKTL